MSVIVQPIGRFANKAEWELMDDWSVETPYGLLQINAGYLSDGASIPRFLWSLVGPRYAPDTFPAALAHDALYSAHLPEVADWRGAADAIFLDLLKRLGVGRAKRVAYYVAVRIFGWAVARQHTNIGIEAARKLVRMDTP
ncbi:MAG: DUF1353 domain-containing protein [Candidatus Hydrogenedentes bacterium]|nr:DUF1353 domain-containing protein [Candidatus Hydrogenedentota bacterium]